VALSGEADAAELDWVFLRVDPRGVSDTADRVRDALARRGKAALTLYPLVLPVLMGKDVDRFAAVSLAMFLACLVMGAVVMMNLGLLNVLARRREIAIRRTEGATARDIGRQFLAEGFFLAIIGAGLGCALGIVLAIVRASLEPTTGFTWTFPYVEAAAAVAVALLVGTLASVLPAWRASRNDPIEGLADE
jgi:putative ABC transport system permease protein